MSAIWLAFGSGLFLGALGGVSVMCLVAINRSND